MAGYQLDMNVQQHNIDAVMLVDELSSIEYYIGVSRNTKNEGKANWRIKKIWKDGTTWRFEFPEGDQDFKWVWGDRLTYTYSA
jgi:hypothetical protein